MEEENDEQSPRLTGIVIITLPPPDNPSLGKTITAFTLSDHQASTPQSPQLDQPQPALQAGEWSPPPPSQDHGPQLFFSFGSARRTLLPVLGISLIALYICVSLSQEAFFQLKDELGSEDDPQKNKSQNTFIFPLYQKRYWGNSGLGDFELKLGRLNRIDPRSFSEELGDELSRGRINPKTASTASKIDATGVIPVGVTFILTEFMVIIDNNVRMKLGTGVVMKLRAILPVYDSCLLRSVLTWIKDGWNSYVLSTLLASLGHPRTDPQAFPLYHAETPGRPYTCDFRLSDLRCPEQNRLLSLRAKGAHPFYKPVKATHHTT
ncbi:UNVERIFIED_CONTAM: Aspartyl protease APCB1 [Sesamum radiatum]|uniref:Aspartyl protease APCB1 n=1 Tax=Sesamum radiatum TaxID=300843 RepID=A0AAW2VPQ5_SESRA